MGTLERRERERQEVRDKILDAARRLFATEGYEAVTMRKIAERIEYSPTAIYAHFADKEALIRELCEKDFTLFAQRFVTLLGVEDPVERMKRAGQVYVEFALEHPQHYRLMFMTPRLRIETDTSGRDDPQRNAYVFLRATLQQAMTQGRLRPEHTNADLVAQTVWATLHGLVALEITAYAADDEWMNWTSFAERRDAIVALILRGVLKEA